MSHNTLNLPGGSTKYTLEATFAPDLVETECLHVFANNEYNCKIFYNFNNFHTTA